MPAEQPALKLTYDDYVLIPEDGKLYEKYDMQEYWIVDPALATVKVYRREGEPFVRVADLAEEASDLLTTPLLPGFEYPLNTLFS